MSTEYWVYVNTSLKKAQLHKSKCSACRFGQALKRNSENSPDWWEGPFDSRDSGWESTQAAATKVGGMASKCMMCHP